MPLILVLPSLPFEIWAIDFVEPFPTLGRQTRARYIIIVVEYLTKWGEEEPIEWCTHEVAAKFIYEHHH